MANQSVGTHFQKKMIRILGEMEFMMRPDMYTLTLHKIGHPKSEDVVVGAPSDRRCRWKVTVAIPNLNDLRGEYDSFEEVQEKLSSFREKLRWGADNKAYRWDILYLEDCLIKVPFENDPEGKVVGKLTAIWPSDSQ
jgi:hypothetical protein